MVMLLANFRSLAPDRRAALEALGLELRFLPGAETERYDLDFSDVDAVVCYRLFAANDISRFPALRFIQLTSHGTDHLPLDAIRARGIALHDCRGTYGAPMAEFALGGVLQLYKAAPQFYRQQAARVWRQNRHLRELGGKQVCIVGAGSIGTECARRFRAMGCRVVGLCRHPRPDADYDAQRAVSELDAVLPESDIVILALPLTAESRGLFDARRFGCMKPGAVLVNIARGPVVDSGALCGALADGRLSGAVVDVCDEEPLPADSPLWTAENLILTPHNSFAGERNPDRLFALLYENTKNWIDSIGGTKL